MVHFRKYLRKGVLVDANLLLGFLVGSIEPRHLATCHATTKYFGADDFPLLERFLARFDRIITTPHVLTEVSNLGGRLPESLRREFRVLLRAVIGKLTEQFEPAESIFQKEDFLRFGLTDTAISMIAPRRYLVLTDDMELAGLLNKRRVDVVNFIQIRMAVWDSDSRP